MSIIAEFTLQGVNGDTINLTDRASKIRMGPSPSLFGDASPVVEFVSSPALVAGETTSGSVRDAGVPRPLDFVILGDSQNECFELVERLAAATDATRGTVQVTAKRPSGIERSIRLLRTQSINPDFGAYDGTTLTFNTMFRATNPYWADLVPQVPRLSFPVTGTGATDTPWAADIPWDDDIPWAGYRSVGTGGLVTTDVHSNGTGPSWPKWEITGPFTGAEMVNGSNPQRPLIFTGDVLEGETLVIETREQSRSARVGSMSRMGEFDLVNSDFWHLVTGKNSITVAVGGFTNTATSLRLSFVPQHRTL